jgi:type III restriction enzyme
MQFQFDANQKHQIDAIEAVVALLEGQPRIEADPTFSLDTGLAAVANRLDLDDEALIQNLQAVQKENGIAPDTAICCIEETIETAAGPKKARFPNFSVEMETGTGKTYVYLRTALELFRRFGLRKFIVVVPSVAIREGVLKTLQVTEKHLRERYGNLPYRYDVYDSDNLSQVRQFALSSGLELMVMTIDSFNKASNVIRQTTDRLQGETPIHLVQATRPILILDEPQNMESELRVKALSLLDPLFALRYSATHRNPYNVVYRLTPYEAYRHGLVKRIEVASVIKEDDANQIFLRLDGIKTEKKTITARIALHKLMKQGVVKEQVVTVRPGDALEEKANRKEYAGFQVEEIHPGSGFVRFANNLELKIGESRGADKEALFEAQIRYAIEEHFRKQAKLKDAGIKVLSLFFIDRVANYVGEGIIRKLFISAFNEIKARPEHISWKEIDPERVQAAYFAQKRRKGGEVNLLDSTSGKSKEDEEAYDLIMKDKERLLSFEEPVAFIFSHSALREGWDNPNVFQICTLNQTASEMKKRQEIGRGVRLAVNQTGNRVRDERVNVLTVIANESYERYVERLQTEIEEEYGKEGLPPKPANARKRRVVKLRKAYTLKLEFRTLWEKIRQKTRYAVQIDTEKLLEEVVPEIDKMEIRPPRVTVTKAYVEVASEGGFEAYQISPEKIVLNLAGRHPLPNLIEIMTNLMEQTTPPVRLTRATLLEVFKRARNKAAALDNPQEFATVAVRIIKEKMADHLVKGIRYEKIDEWYEMTQFEDILSWEEYLVPSRRPDGSEGAGLYDHMIWESEIEREFAEGLERRDDVKLYVKLPDWFKVETPVGTYNPDWAIVLEDRDTHGNPTGKPFFYLVRETKGENWRSDARPDERRKILCGEKHFKQALQVDYDVISKVSQVRSS